MKSIENGTPAAVLRTAIRPTVAAVLSNGRLGEHVTLRHRPYLTSSSSSITTWTTVGRHEDEHIYKRNSRPVHAGKSSPRACDHRYFV